MTTKKIHVISLVFFTLAFIFYILASNVAITFGALGVISEIIAWIIWLLKGNKQKDHRAD